MPVPSCSCYHTQIEVKGLKCSFTQSQCTETSPSTDGITPGVLQATSNHWSLVFVTRPGQATISLSLSPSFSLSLSDRLVGLVVRRPPRERKIPGANPVCAGIFLGRVIPVTQKLALQWLPCQAPDVIGSTLGLVGPVSVYWLGEVESLICNFYLSVAARKIAWANQQTSLSLSLWTPMCHRGNRAVVVRVVVVKIVLLLLLLLLTVEEAVVVPVVMVGA